MGIISAISVLHPSLAFAGLAAGLIPLIIHLINRRRHRRVPWAAMAFLLAAARRRARRVRLEQWLLFAIRVLAIVLIGLALSRPYVTASRFLGMGHSHSHRVILLDNSASMGASAGAEWGDRSLTVTARSYADRFLTVTARSDADRSLTVAVRSDSARLGSVYDRAREVASTLIDSLPKTDEVSIVSLAEPASAVIDYPSFDRRRIRDALAKLPLTQRSTDVAGGLDHALDLLEKSSAAPENRYVYVISDVAGEAWSPGSDEATGEGNKAWEPSRDRKGADRVQPSRDRKGADLGNGRRNKPTVGRGNVGGRLALAARRVAERAALVLVPVGEPGAANASISRLALESTVTAARVPVCFAADVVNYGATELRGGKLQIGVLAGGAHATEHIDRRIALPTLGPGHVETVTFSMVFDSAGAHTLLAHLDLGATRPDREPDRQDRLALDNDRRLSLEVIEALGVLVVDGAPGRTRLSGQAGYLLTALNPWGASQSDAIVSAKAISDLQLGGEVLSKWDVVVLCNVRRLDGVLWQRLRSYVEGGGGLLVFAGEAVDVDQYNRLGYAAGDGVLPGSLKPPEGELEGSDSVRSDLGFAAGELAHPVMTDFEGVAASGLFAARVDRRMPIEFDESTGEVVLRYTDKTPAVVIRRRGAGRSCFVTTTADMAWNNLPARGDYVSLMTNLIAYLAQPQPRDRNIEVGEPIVRRLTAEESSMPPDVRLPCGETQEAPVSVVDGEIELRYTATERVGLYTTFVGGAARTVAVNPPSAEGNLEPVDATALAKIIDAPFTEITDRQELVTHTGAPSTRELGSGLMIAVLILLLCETWLAMRQGHRRDERHRPTVRARGTLHREGNEPSL